MSCRIDSRLTFKITIENSRFQTPQQIPSKSFFIKNDEVGRKFQILEFFDTFLKNYHPFGNNFQFYAVLTQNYGIKPKYFTHLFFLTNLQFRCLPAKKRTNFKPPTTGLDCNGSMQSKQQLKTQRSLLDTRGLCLTKGTLYRGVM